VFRYKNGGGVKDKWNSMLDVIEIRCIKISRLFIIKDAKAIIPAAQVKHRTMALLGHSLARSGHCPGL
jgi:hypothetical protein